jgi:Dolichyl-phosphate-mannose-protein mannosyltransferase
LISTSTPPTGLPSGIRHLVRLRDDLPGRLVLAAAAVAAALSAVRALLPMPWLGDGAIWRAADTAAIARNFYRGDMNLFLPQIDWGGNGPGYVETELPVVPWLAAVAYHVTGEHAAVGRLIVVGFGMLAAAAFWGLVRRILPPAPARWALLAFVASPALMRWGNAFMPDVAVLALVLLTLVAFQRWLAEDRWVWLAATGVAACAAGLAKSTALHVGLVLVLWLLLADRRRFRRPALYVTAVAALVPVGLWLWHAGNLYRTYGNTFGVISGGDSKFGNLAIWTSAAFWSGNASIEAVDVYGLVGIPVALAGAVVAWRARGPVLLAAGLPAVALFYLIVGRYSMGLGVQYHTFSVPYAAILEGLGAAALLSWLAARARSRLLHRLGVAALVASLSAVSLAAFSLSFQDCSGVLAVCARELAAVSAPGELAVVATTSPAIDHGVPNNYEEPQVFYLADRKGWSLPADRHDPALLAEYAGSGARWFVEPAPALLAPGGPLTTWLGGHARQVRTVATDGCDLWLLERG